MTRQLRDQRQSSCAWSLSRRPNPIIPRSQRAREFTAGPCGGLPRGVEEAFIGQLIACAEIPPHRQAQFAAGLNIAASARQARSKVGKWRSAWKRHYCARAPRSEKSARLRMDSGRRAEKSRERRQALSGSDGRLWERYRPAAWPTQLARAHSIRAPSWSHSPAVDNARLDAPDTLAAPQMSSTPGFLINQPEPKSWPTGRIPAKLSHPCAALAIDGASNCRERR